MAKIIVGVLAIQGDFAEHQRSIESLGLEAIQVRTKADLQKCSALIIPGGESTTIAKLIADNGIASAISSFAKKGFPVYGTCAGAIVIAKKILGEKRFRPLNLIGIEVARNAYGRQVDSFEAEIEVKGAGKMNVVFIRAPVITKIGKGVEVLASFEGKPVLVTHKNVLAGTFHTELGENTKLHSLLAKMAKGKN
ncbi:MAG: pyridoxal 5'-phosphate synthase glutaminase subunit PdxT [archaeon]